MRPQTVCTGCRGPLAIFVPILIPIAESIAEEFAEALELSALADWRNHERNFFAALEWIVSHGRKGQKDIGSAESEDDHSTAGYAVVDTYTAAGHEPCDQPQNEPRDDTHITYPV